MHVCTCARVYVMNEVCNAMRCMCGGVPCGAALALALASLPASDEMRHEAIHCTALHCTALYSVSSSGTDHWH